ncbi:hypothetical protein SDC9_157058 [bioreactor metagenome]|uniref:Uncharacterized protein n=1 Tax=bioreactor metagenome TaxID=1076179 RepID=A0A645F819_9ZZZZ
MSGGRIIIQQADHPPLFGMGQLLDKARRSAAHTKHEHGPTQCLMCAVLALLLEHTIGHAPATHDDGQEHRVEQQHRPRKGGLGLQHQTAHRNRQSTRQNRLGQPHQIRKTGEYPDTPIQTGSTEDDGLHRHQQKQADHSKTVIIRG